MTFEKLISIIALITVPLSILAHLKNWGTTAIFISSGLAIIPLAIGLSVATEKVAEATGPTKGGLVNAIFGSATGLIIALVALKEGLVDLVKASITGSILCDLLLFLGLAMLTGGLRYKELKFKPVLAQVNGVSMTLAVIAIALPTLVIETSNMVELVTINRLSIIVATVLIIVYGLTLLFSLKTHSYLYDISLAIKDNSPLNSEKIMEKNYLAFWVGVLLIATVGVAFESELFVDVISEVIQQIGLTPLFTGVILLPLISDIAGIVTVVRLALKNQMDLTVAIAMGDSLLVALFTAPLLVLGGIIVNQDMNLNFNPFEVVALAIAVTITNLINFNGNSNWLEGTLLLATYLILGVAFFYHPV